MRNRTENQITLVLIRHGATKSNREHRYLGKTDEPLSEEGEKELSEYRKSQCYPEVDCLFASPMKRCMQTAEILYPGKKLLQIEEWEETDFGTFEGRNYMELQDDVRYRAWIESNGILPFPKGESREEFILRCEKGFLKMQKKATQLAEKEKIEALGLIVHGGTIMALLSKYYGGEYFEYQVANGKGYICTVKDWKDDFIITELKKI